MTDEELTQELRRIHVAISELDSKQFLMVLSPVLVRLKKEYGAEKAKEMLVSTIDILAANARGPVA